MWRLGVGVFAVKRGLKLFAAEAQRSFKQWVAPTQIELTRRKRRMEPKPVIRSSFLEWNREAELYAFNKRLSEQFNKDLLEQAFTHKSYIIREEMKQKEMGIEDAQLNIKDNEELVMRGDQLASKAVENYLIDGFPRAPEEAIRAIHDFLMSEETLARAALHLGTRDIILTEEYPVKQETLAKTFLALVGALAESVDENHAAIFVRDFLITALAEKDLTEVWSPSNPMEMINEILARDNRAPAEPRLIAKAGIKTLLSVYQIALYSNKEFLGSGFGQTIEEAQTVAALNTLYGLFGFLDSSKPLKFNKPIDITQKRVAQSVA